MSYSREFIPKNFSTGADLDNDLAGIGIRVACESPTVDPNIEDTLIAAVIDELLHKNTRSLALMTDWLSLYSRWINVERLYRAITALNQDDFNKVYIFFSAIGHWLEKDRRFKKISSLYSGKKMSYLALAGLPDLTKNLIKRNGKDSRFINGPLLIPNKIIRRAPQHIMPIEEIAQIHMPFKYRVIMGANFRADLWGTLHRNPQLSSYQLAKKTYSVYESARTAKNDYQRLNSKINLAS